MVGSQKVSHCKTNCSGRIAGGDEYFCGDGVVQYKGTIKVEKTWTFENDDSSSPFPVKSNELWTRQNSVYEVLGVGWERMTAAQTSIGAHGGTYAMCSTNSDYDPANPPTGNGLISYTNYSEKYQVSTASLIYEVTNVKKISFWYKGKSEANGDHFSLLIDGVVKLDSEDQTTWTQYEYDFGADYSGTHTVEIRYYKDNSQSYHWDRFCIDDLKFELASECNSSTCKEAVNGNYSGALLTDFPASTAEMCDPQDTENHSRDKLCNRALGLNLPDGSYYPVQGSTTTMPKCTNSCSIEDVNSGCNFCGDGVLGGSEQCEMNQSTAQLCQGETKEYYKTIAEKTWDFENSSSPYGRPAEITEIRNKKYSIINSAGFETTLTVYDDYTQTQQPYVFLHNLDPEGTESNFINNYSGSNYYYPDYNSTGTGWTRQTGKDSHNAYCTNSLADKGMAELKLQIETAAAGKISFEYWGGSEGNNHCEGGYVSETMFDGLLVYVNQEPQFELEHSGQNADLMVSGSCKTWRTFEKNVGKGSVPLTFRFFRDNGTGENGNQFCIDNIKFLSANLVTDSLSYDPSDKSCSGCEKTGSCYSYCGDGVTDNGANGMPVYFNFNEGSGSTVTNSGTLGGTYSTPSGGSWISAGKQSSAYTFNGNGYIETQNFEYNTSYRNNFTMMAWVKPNSTIYSSYSQTNSGGGAATASYNKFIFGAVRGTGDDPHHHDGGAGAGVSVGTNGIVVAVHAASYMPPLAVYYGYLGTNWYHVAVVFEDRTPRIYLDGNLVQTGLQADKEWVFPSGQIGGGQYGNFNGSLDEVRMVGKALSANEIKAAMSASAVSEVCDDGSRNSNDYYASSANAHCNSTCSGLAPHCGDGTKNGNEKCDGSDVSGYCYKQRDSKCGDDCDGYYDCYDIYYYACTDSCTLTKGSTYKTGVSSYSSYTTAVCP